MSRSSANEKGDEPHNLDPSTEIVVAPKSRMFIGKDPIFVEDQGDNGKRKVKDIVIHEAAGTEISPKDKARKRIKKTLQKPITEELTLKDKVTKRKKLASHKPMKKGCNAQQKLPCQGAEHVKGKGQLGKNVKDTKIVCKSVDDKADDGNVDENKQNGNGVNDRIVLHTRTCPGALHDALIQLNNAQKNAVIDMGFGYLLRLRIRDVPGNLAYRVVDMFDHENCELVIDDNIVIKITEEDVFRVFGFPKGQNKIKTFDFSSSNELMEEWITLFNVRKRSKIKIKLLLSKMLGETDGGTWFRRHFLIAVQFCLMESYPNGIVHPFILRCLEDVQTVKNWNWGEYVIRTLVEQKDHWVKNGKTTFTGPVLFLVLIYVDRMVLSSSSHKRSFPILLNWTSGDLRTRQKLENDASCFGSGSLRGPISVDECNVPDFTNFEIGTSSGAGTFLLTKVDKGASSGAGATFDDSKRIMMMKLSVEIAERKEALNRMIAETTIEQRNSKVFKDTVVTCSDISGITLGIDNEEDQVNTCNTNDKCNADELPSASSPGMDIPAAELEKDRPIRVNTKNDDVNSEVALGECIGLGNRSCLVEGENPIGNKNGQDIDMHDGDLYNFNGSDYDYGDSFLKDDEATIQHFDVRGVEVQDFVGLSDVVEHDCEPVEQTTLPEIQKKKGKDDVVEHDCEPVEQTILPEIQKKKGKSDVVEHDCVPVEQTILPEIQKKKGKSDVVEHDCEPVEQTILPEIQKKKGKNDVVEHDCEPVEQTILPEIQKKKGKVKTSKGTLAVRRSSRVVRKEKVEQETVPMGGEQVPDRVKYKYDRRSRQR